MVVGGGINQRLLCQLSRGEYVVNAQAVADAIIKRARWDRADLSQMLVASKAGPPAPGVDEADPAPLGDLP
jgi:hypothetical protein